MNAPTLQRPMIYVADDDAAMRLLLQEVLTANGYRVEAWDSARPLIQRVDQAEPQLILLDVSMPGMDGFTACRYLRGRPGLQNIPIVMITSNDDDQSVNEAYSAGATDFIAKPVNWSLIGHRMRYILRNGENQRSVYRLAYFDTLTGLPNRQHFSDDLRRYISQASDQSRSVAAVCLDLDLFKRINDTFGHSVGDRLLQTVAARLQDLVTRRSTDQDRELTIARLGGDEFTVLIKAVGAQSIAMELAEEVRWLCAQPIAYHGHEFVVTPSIGIAVYPNHGQTAEALLKNADTAMYRAKSSGRNAIVVYEASMNATAPEALALESELRIALERGQLTVAYQPKCRASDGKLIGAEALVRWIHPTHGEIPAARFVPIAEESGMIVGIGRHVLESVLRQIGDWARRGFPHIPIAVNFSAYEFCHGDILRFIEAALDRHNIPARLIEIEITESVLMRDIAAVRICLARIRARGCRIAVDDFGTGYSSLAYLRTLPLDTLKIDQSFIRDLCTDATSAAICDSIIALAHGLHLEVVAEGVETAAQLEYLRERGCDIAQGYWLGRPMSPQAFAELLAPNDKDSMPATA
jgi:diguanylate cyclase (GGDEF)-like protein